MTSTSMPAAATVCTRRRVASTSPVPPAKSPMAFTPGTSPLRSTGSPTCPLPSCDPPGSPLSSADIAATLEHADLEVRQLCAHRSQLICEIVGDHSGACLGFRQGGAQPEHGFHQPSIDLDLMAREQARARAMSRLPKRKRVPRGTGKPRSACANARSSGSSRPATRGNRLSMQTETKGDYRLRRATDERSNRTGYRISWSPSKLSAPLQLSSQRSSRGRGETPAPASQCP